MLEIIAAHDVKLGMFVAELDRPWLGTPFALQGFLVSNLRQIEALRESCSFVSVDRAKSVFTEFSGLPEPDWSLASIHGTSVGDWVKSVSTPEETVDAPSRRPLPPLISEDKLAPRPARRPVPACAEPSNSEAPPQTLRPMRAPGRVEVVAGTKKRRSLQLNKQAYADLERVVSEPSAYHFGISHHTVYVDRTTVDEEMLASGAAFGRAQELMIDVSLELSKDKLPQPERIREAVDDLVQSMVRNPDALIWLSKLKRSDNYSYDHSLDVSIHMMAFGRHLGFPPDQLNVLGLAGLLQDVGKTRVPLGLLQQANPLTPAERAVLRRHVEYGTRILATHPGIPERVIDVAARHHERHDGSGYPHRLAGEAIGMFGEMAGLVDAYCAMSYDRPYRPGLDNQRVLRKLHSARGKSFSEPLIIEFIQCVGLYPLGTLVELRSGEVGVVVEQNRIRRLKPRVLVLLDKEKSALARPFTLDLKDEAQSEDGSLLRIWRALPAGSYGIDPREFYL